MGHFDTFDNSIGIITAGIVGDEVKSFDNSIITIGSADAGFGGVVLDIEDDLEVFDNSTVNMFQGRVFDDVEATSFAEINFFGGEFDEDVEAFDESVINIFGGLYNTGFGDLDDDEGGKIQVEDFEIAPEVFITNSARINIHGGIFLGAPFEEDITAEGNGTIKIYGSNFAINGVAAESGEITGFAPGPPPFPQLTGVLEDGSFLDNDFKIEGNGRIILVVLGDANGDGVLSNFDIAPFVQALTDPAAYQTEFPDADPDCMLDMNRDGVFSNLDIADFVAALTGGGAN